MNPTINTATNSITTPTINFKIPLSSSPFGVSIRNKIPTPIDTKTDKKIAIADIACGITCTKMNQTNPIPSAINKLNLIVSYVFKNVHFY